MSTSTVENYLKAILQLEQSGDARASVGRIAEELKVTPGTVSMMLKQLSEQELVRYVPRRHVSLLDKGRRHALSVVRRHRLVETFLVEVMGLDWSEVHEEAEVLEHVISDRLLARIDEMLSHPSHDPHGDPIPQEDGSLPKEGAFISLAKAKAGRYRLVRVDDTEAAFLTWLSQQNLKPGSCFELHDEERVAGLLKLSSLTDPKTAAHLSLESASKVLVEAV